MGHRRWRGRLAGSMILLLAILWITGGANSAQAKEILLLSESKEIELGKQLDQEMEKHYGFCGNPGLVSYIDQIGQKIASQAAPRSFRYVFKVLDDDSINAMALPGGYIYVTRGLLAVLNNEAELAAIIAHEVGHASCRHAAKQVTKARLFQLLSLGALGLAVASPEARGYADAWFMASNEFFTQILLGYGRENELEADEKGVRFTYQAGYDPRAISEFLRYLRTKEQLSGFNFQGFYITHPETAERIIKADTLAFVLATGSQSKMEIGANQFRSQLEGLPYGDKNDRLFLRVYTIHAGDTLASISKNLLGNESRSHELAFLNRMKEGASLEQGTIIKYPSR